MFFRSFARRPSDLNKDRQSQGCGPGRTSYRVTGSQSSHATSNFTAHSTHRGRRSGLSESRLFLSNGQVNGIQLVSSTPKKQDREIGKYPQKIASAKPHFVSTHSRTDLTLIWSSLACCSALGHNTTRAFTLICPFADLSRLPKERHVPVQLRLHPQGPLVI